MANQDTKDSGATPPNPVAAGGLDFASLDVQADIDSRNGAWMHVAHPLTGELLYADEAREKPCEVLVLSVESRKYNRRVHPHVMKALRTRKMSADETDKHALAMAVSAIDGFRNIIHSGRELDGGNRRDKELWVRLAPDFVTQVREFSEDLDHFTTPDGGNS